MKKENKSKFGAAIVDQESSPAKQDQLVASIFDEIKKQAESFQSPVIFNHELLAGLILIIVKIYFNLVTTLRFCPCLQHLSHFNISAASNFI